jgi:hypothetical protein
MIAQGKPQPATLGLMKELIEKETARLNEIGVRQTVATIQACVVDFPVKLTDDVLLDMAEDEFSALSEVVQSVIWRMDEKLFVLKEELSKVLKDGDLENALNVVDNVFSGRAEKNDS